MIKERLEKLRDLMKKNQIDAYIIPTQDFHESEYVGDYFMSRKYMSGFTGSAATLIVTIDEAGLWTDGRYFIQAAKQLEGSTITLYKIDVESVPTTFEFLKDNLKDKGTIGFDGRVISTNYGLELKDELKEKDISIVYDKDLVDFIWKDRPALPSEPAFLLDTKYSGKTHADKLQALRKKMKEKGSTSHIITTLDDIAWLFNLRGRDIPYNPVVLAYSIITLEQTFLFIDKEKLNKEIIEQLDSDNVILKDYNEIYNFTKRLLSNEVVLLDKKKVNYSIYSNLNSNIKIINEDNPTILMKAVKNSTEVNNLKNAHIKDGLAFTKFMYWLKNNIGKEEISEISASDYLEECRKEQEGFIELSFDTISAYKENAAMMHYFATDDTNKTLEAEGLYLVDSGGQYYEGTTDITRTIALGPVEEEQKKHFTAVLRSMLNLSNAKFLHGCIGLNLDILARGPIWDMNLDYRSGTGHGVGYLLNVHEGPNSFRWKYNHKNTKHSIIEAGMVTTNEPGIYIEGSHGIRIENELLASNNIKNEYGHFMYFETITFAPIDIDAIDIDYMTELDKERLNKYHKEVYEKLSPYLNKEEQDWLAHYTREI